MNQPQQLNVSCDFNGYLLCQMPQDIVEVELINKDQMGKVHFTQRLLHQDGEI